MSLNRANLVKVWSVLFSLFFLEKALAAEKLKEDPLLAFINMDQHKYEDAIALRSFVRDIILASSKKESRIAHQMRKAIAKHPKILHRLVVKNSLKYWYEVFSLANIPLPLESVNSCLQSINNVMNSGELSKAIADFMRDYTSTYTSIWEFLQYDDRMLMLERFSDETLVFIAKMILLSIDKIDFSKEPCLQSLKDPEQGLSIGYVPDAFLDFAYLLIDQYFNKYEAKEKAIIIADILSLKPHCSKIEKLAAFLNGSGPVVQKFFQLMGEHVESEKIRKIVNGLKSRVKPFSYKHAKAVLEKSYKKPLEKMFFKFEKKPLAAATIAQVHRAYFKKYGKPVIVKIKRPDVEIRARKEISIIRSLTDNVGILKLTSKLEEIINEETNLELEAQYLKSGLVYNNASKGIHAVRLIEKYPPKKGVLMMELAKGKNIDKFNKIEDLKLKSIGLKRLYKAWLKEAFFGEGFFHADLHSGNLFYKRTKKSPGYLLTLLDFGSVGKLNHHERKALIKLGLGISMSEPQLVMRGFSPFENMSCNQAREYYSVVEDILSQNLDAAEKTNLILDEAINREFSLSKDFLQFNRGKAFLEDLIFKNNSDLSVVGGENWQVSSWGIYSKMILKKVPGQLKKSLFGKINNPSSLLDKITLDFTWQYIKEHFLLGHYKPGEYDVCEGREM